MEPTQKKRGPAPVYSKKVSLYESPEGIRLLGELAERRGVSQAALIRMLVREEAARVGLEYRREQGGTPGQ